MTRFVSVPFDALSSALAMAGFTQLAQRQGRAHGEVVLTRPVRGGLHIRVWTSTKDGQAEAAACGADAIRVTLVHVADGRTAGVSSATKVLRTGTVEAVIERVLARAREMWALGAKLDKGPRCLCGAPKYLDSGRCVDRANPAHLQHMAAASVKARGAR